MEKVGISILYVEDEDYIRSNMVRSLERRVKKIYSAANGLEGLESFKRYEPDLVITDIKMPVLNGLEMIKKIRKLKEDTKFIMLSAHSDTSSLLEAIEIGVQGYILKPFQTQKLFKLIEEQADIIILDKKVIEQSKKINELYNALIIDLETAGSVQSYLLPDYLIVERDLFFSSTYVPSSKIGGDLYDIIKISETEYISYIGDISGHGVKAALLMTAVKTTITRIIEDEKLHEPHLILNRLSTILTRELFSSDYMTMLLCYINCEKNYIKILNAGHPPLILYHNKKKTITTLVQEGSIPIGWVPNYLYTPDEELKMRFDSNQTLLLYTDGLFECENAPGEELGLHGLKEFIEETTNNYPLVLLPVMIRDTLKKNNYDISGDDFTLVALRRIPEQRKAREADCFSGDLKSESSLILQRLLAYVEQEIDDEAFRKEISSLNTGWLKDLMDLEIYLPEKEVRYLAEIKKPSKNSVIVSIWIKTINLAKGTRLVLKEQESSLPSLENITLDIQYTSYDGFVEIQLNFAGNK